jgi:predicted small metal-binding protein
MREAVVHELDCGCGRHLEGKDEQCLVIKVFLHLEAAHPEIEEPTIELTEEMVAIKAYETSTTSTRIWRHLS